MRCSDPLLHQGPWWDTSLKLGLVHNQRRSMVISTSILASSENPVRLFLSQWQSWDSEPMIDSFKKITHLELLTESQRGKSLTQGKENKNFSVMKCRSRFAPYMCYLNLFYCWPVLQLLPLPRSLLLLLSCYHLYLTESYHDILQILS